MKTELAPQKILAVFGGTRGAHKQHAFIPLHDPERDVPPAVIRKVAVCGKSWVIELGDWPMPEINQCRACLDFLEANT